MSTAAIIIVDPDETYSPDRFSPHIGYVLVLTAADPDSPVPDSPAEDGEWLVVFRNTKPLNRVMFRGKVKDVLDNGSNVTAIAVNDRYRYEDVWELPTIEPTWKD